jgi:4-amino-4-deoxy-L-arabinose transferase-like glycosyltransferase
MFVRRDWISPTLGGRLWFEKPALLYWMMILSFKLFGVSEWAARFPAALSGVLTVAAVFQLSRQVDRSVDETNTGDLGFWSTLACASTLGVIVFSRAASFDIVLTMTITWALACFFTYDVSAGAKKSRWLLFGFYAFIGFSVLAKGLIGFIIPLGVVSTYFLFRRTVPNRQTLASLIWGLPVAVATAATWYVPVTLKHGWPFIDQFFIQHQFTRYLSDKYHHPAPFYYYPVIVLMLTLPWTSFFIAGVLRAGKLIGGGSERDANALNSTRRLMLLALAWLLVPVVFFTFSSSKLPGYILPVLPAAALMVGERFSQSAAGLVRRYWPLNTTAALSIVFAIVTAAYGWRSGNLAIWCAIVIAAVGLATGIYALLWPRRPTPIIFVAAATFCVLIVLLNCGADRFVARESSKQLLQLADTRGYAHLPIYGLQRDERTPEFYAPERVVYDDSGEPVFYEDPGQVLSESSRRSSPVLVFMRPKQLSVLSADPSARVEIIGNNGKLALVAVSAR